MIKRALTFLYTLPKTFYRIPFLVPYWGTQELVTALDIMLRRKIIKGEDEEQFVKDFCNLIGARYGIATNMGRSAIELALRGSGVGNGDEVILPTFACRGVITPVIRAGCTPVLVDIDDDFNISPQSVRDHVSEKTRAIIVPHLSGKVAKIEEIKGMVKDRDIFVIEDACQATGGKHNSSYLGMLGDVGIFSFGMGKNMMATAGGLLVTNSQELYNNIQNLEIEREHTGEVLRRAGHRIVKFRLSRYTSPFFIIKGIAMGVIAPHHPPQIVDQYRLARMSNLDTALLRIQLSKLGEIIDKRRKNAKILCQELSQIEHIIFPDFDNEHIFTKFLITLKEGNKPTGIGLGEEVRRFATYLRKASIECEQTYTPLHLRDGFQRYCKGRLPKSEDLYWRSTTLPVQPHLKERDMMYISKIVKRFFGE